MFCALGRRLWELLGSLMGVLCVVVAKILRERLDCRGGVGPKKQGASRGQLGRDVRTTGNFRMYTNFFEGPCGVLRF